MPTAISISRIVKVFTPTGKAAAGVAAPAVDDVSIDITPGELFFLLGPSGCGKTTLLRMVAGFIEPTSGGIAFDEGDGPRDVTWTPPNRRNTGMVFQSYALWPHMTVAQNVAFGLELRKIGKDEQSRRVREALAVVQMEEYRDRRPTQLSGGQQQRVALARALVIRPSVLLLDEPLSNLDAKLRNDLRSEIRKICKQSNLTTIYVTHDQKEALSMADRIAIMRRGKIVQVGSPTALYRSPNDRFVAEFLGETNLLEGMAEETNKTQTIVGFGSNRVVSEQEPDAPMWNKGSLVFISIRPEAIRIGSGLIAKDFNSLRGHVVESSFLGETAQHIVRLNSGSYVRVAQLNPLAARPLIQGAPVVIEFDSTDVAVLPFEPDRDSAMRLSGT